MGWPPLYQGVASIQFFSQAGGSNCTDNTVQCSHRTDNTVQLDRSGEGRLFRQSTRYHGSLKNQINFPSRSQADGAQARGRRRLRLLMLAERTLVVDDDDDGDVYGVLPILARDESSKGRRKDGRLYEGVERHESSGSHGHSLHYFTGRWNWGAQAWHTQMQRCL